MSWNVDRIKLWRVLCHPKKFNFIPQQGEVFKEFQSRKWWIDICFKMLSFIVLGKWVKGDKNGKWRHLEIFTVDQMSLVLSCIYRVRNIQQLLSGFQTSIALQTAVELQKLLDCMEHLCCQMVQMLGIQRWTKHRLCFPLLQVIIN